MLIVFMRSRKNCPCFESSATRVSTWRASIQLKSKKVTFEWDSSRVADIGTVSWALQWYWLTWIGIPHILNIIVEPKHDWANTLCGNNKDTRCQHHVTRPLLFLPRKRSYDFTLSRDDLITFRVVINFCLENHHGMDDRECSETQAICKWHARTLAMLLLGVCIQSVGKFLPGNLVSLWIENVWEFNFFGSRT